MQVLWCVIFSNGEKRAKTSFLSHRIWFFSRKVKNWDSLKFGIFVQITAVYMCFYTFCSVFIAFQWFLLLYLQLRTMLLILLKMLNFYVFLRVLFLKGENSAKTAFLSHRIWFFSRKVKNWDSLKFGIFVQITAVYMCFYTFCSVFIAFQWFLLLYLQLRTMLLILLKMLQFLRVFACFVFKKRK